LPVPESPHEQRGDAQPARAAAGKAPFVMDREPMAHVRLDLPQGVMLGVRQDEVVPARTRFDGLRERAHGARLTAACVAQPGGQRIVGHRHGPFGKCGNTACAQPVVAGQCIEGGSLGEGDGTRGERLLP